MNSVSRSSGLNEACSVLAHGVVAVFDSGDLDDGSTFLVMERLRGRDLAGLLAGHGRGSLRQAASLVRQAGEAIGAAHRAGRVHRDIKPANVFLSDSGGGFSVKVLDFGLAKPNQLDSTLTQTGALVGTPAYMSPEQVQGHALDERSDVYSLAAVVFEALTGRRLVATKEFVDRLRLLQQSGEGGPRQEVWATSNPFSRRGGQASPLGPACVGRNDSPRL